MGFTHGMEWQQCRGNRGQTIRRAAPFRPLHQVRRALHRSRQGLLRHRTGALQLRSRHERHDHHGQRHDLRHLQTCPVFNMALSTPFPGAGNDRTLRRYSFFDVGHVFATRTRNWTKPTTSLPTGRGASSSRSEPRSDRHWRARRQSPPICRRRQGTHSARSAVDRPPPSSLHSPPDPGECMRHACSRRRNLPYTLRPDTGSDSQPTLESEARHRRGFHRRSKGAPQGTPESLRYRGQRERRERAWPIVSCPHARHSWRRRTLTSRSLARTTSRGPS